MKENELIKTNDKYREDDGVLWMWMWVLIELLFNGDEPFLLNDEATDD